MRIPEQVSEAFERAFNGAPVTDTNRARVEAGLEAAFLAISIKPVRVQDERFSGPINTVVRLSTVLEAALDATPSTSMHKGMATGSRVEGLE